MSWFNQSLDINERVTLGENNNKKWQFNLNESREISLFVQRQDGYGPNVYVIPDYEINNYNQRLSFSCIQDLTYYSIEHFTNQVYLQKGTYYLVAELPYVGDDMNSYSEFIIRLREIR